MRPLQPSSKQTQWKAHDAPVLCCDWNPVTGFLASGGEDCKYRLWDAYGRQLYCSAPVEYSISAIAWAPSGQYFAVGSFNLLRLCDKAGWSYSRAQPACGSVFALAWTGDSTQAAVAPSLSHSEPPFPNRAPPSDTASDDACAFEICHLSAESTAWMPPQVTAGCGEGNVLFAQLVGREVSCGPWEARQVSAAPAASLYCRTTAAFHHASQPSCEPPTRASTGP